MVRNRSARRACAEASPPGVPAVIDLAHLARMTLGDYRLQQDILNLFDQQIELQIARMAQADAVTLAAVAHTLKGSARSIGAWDLVRASEAVEMAAGPEALNRAMAEVAITGARVRKAISQMRQNEADGDTAL